MPVRDAWWEQMACRAADPEIFDEPPRPTGRAGHRDRYRHNPSWADEALSYCNRCPVRLRCLEEALALQPDPDFAATQRYVVGGVMPDELEALRRRQRRSRR